MTGKKSNQPCVVCNPEGTDPGQYCERHGEELHRLDHRYELFFRLQRTSRGRGHETYDLLLQGECDPCGRVLVSETDPDSLAVAILITGSLDMDARIAEYAALNVEKNYGDLLRERIGQEIVHSWYGNARACIDIFRLTQHPPLHWDIEPRQDEPPEEDGTEPHAPAGGKHSVH